MKEELKTSEDKDHEIYLVRICVPTDPTKNAWIDIKCVLDPCGDRPEKLECEHRIFDQFNADKDAKDEAKDKADSDSKTTEAARRMRLAKKIMKSHKKRL